MVVIVIVLVLLAIAQPWDGGGSSEEPFPGTEVESQETPAIPPGPPSFPVGPASPAPGPKCSLAKADAAIGLTLPGCTVLFTDTSADSDPRGLWGAVDCAADTRLRVVPGGGDPSPQTTGASQPEDGFRRFTVLDGDDVEGERCELGLNDHDEGPTVLFYEGERRVTFLSVRLPADFPLTDDVFQVVMQMKQTQPADNGGGTPVLALEAWDGDWQLRQSDSTGETSDASELWSAPIQTDTWTRFAFDVTYSQDPARGSVKVYADLNGDGDFGDPEEQSEAFRTYTLKVETDGDGSGDGLDEGDPIPSHLRVGLYHNESYPCPAPNGCRVDLDNVQVIAPN